MCICHKYPPIYMVSSFLLAGAQLYSMYVGEGEALLRETFRQGEHAPAVWRAVGGLAVRQPVHAALLTRPAQAARCTRRRARLVAPAIVFFDELDSLVGKRVEGEQTGEVTARILSSFLTEMDGLELAQGVLVMGATNRPQALDTALVRSSRAGRCSSCPVLA